MRLSAHDQIGQQAEEPSQTLEDFKKSARDLLLRINRLEQRQLKVRPVFKHPHRYESLFSIMLSQWHMIMINRGMRRSRKTLMCHVQVKVTASYISLQVFLSKPSIHRSLHAWAVIVTLDFSQTGARRTIKWIMQLWRLFPRKSWQKLAKNLWCVQCARLQESHCLLMVGH